MLANDIAAATDVAGVVARHLPAVVCLESVARALADTDVEVGVQNIHAEPFGAYTGEISAPMVAVLATWAIIGHSERRRDQGETDELIGRKLLRCAEFGLRPILCVGEQLDEREAGTRRGRPSAPSSSGTFVDDRGRCRRACPTTWSSPTSRSGRSAPA